MVSVGTSAQLAVVLPTPLSQSRQLLLAVRADHPQAAGFDVRPYLIPGRAIALAAPSTGGNSIACLVRAASEWAAFAVGAAGGEVPATSSLADAAARDRLHSHLEAAAVAEFTGDNSDGLTMVPTFWGERAAAGPTSPYNGASLRGVTAANFRLPRVYSACCAGVARVLADFMPMQVLEQAGVKRLVGGGGALARSEVLRRAVSRQFGLPVVVDPTQRADAALGVALLMSCGSLVRDSTTPRAGVATTRSCVAKGHGNPSAGGLHEADSGGSTCGPPRCLPSRAADHSTRAVTASATGRVSKDQPVVRAVVVALAVVGAVYLARDAVHIGRGAWPRRS